MSILLSIFVNNLLPVFLVIGTGVLLGVTLRPDVRSISRMALYTLTPCLAFSGLTGAGLTGSETQQIAVFAALSMLSTALLAWLIATLLGWESKRRRALTLSVLVINSGNYGLSVVLFAFGQDAQARAMVYFVISAMLANTFGVAVAAGGGSWRKMLSNVARMPMLYATVGALIVNAFDQIRVPELLMRPITLLANAAVPVMLLILGLQLARSAGKLREHIPAITLASILRLAVAPLIAFLVARLTRVEGVAFDACVLEASMPSGVTSAVLSLEYDLEPEMIAGTVFFSTLCSAFTLSIVISVIR